jgi:hypothetical protein
MMAVRVQAIPEETLRNASVGRPPVMPDLHDKVTGLSCSANPDIALQTM